MKTYEEMAESIASRVKTERKKRSDIRKAVVGAAVPIVVLAVIGGSAALFNGSRDTIPVVSDEASSSENTVTEKAANTFTDTLPVTSAPEGEAAQGEITVIGGGNAGSSPITDTMPVTSVPPYTDDNGQPAEEGGTVDTTVSEDESLEKITSMFEFGAMGFEGYIAYDISELNDNNPWTPDMKLETLPVYKNPCYTFGSGLTFYLDEDSIESRAKYLAQSFGTSIKETAETFYVGDLLGMEGDEDTVNKYKDKICYRRCVCEDGTEITVDGDGSAMIEFTPARELPADIDVNDHDAVEQYIIKEYAPPFMDAPVGNRYVYDRDIYGDRNENSFTLFRKADDEFESIYGYNFDTVTIHLNDENKVWIIYVNEMHGEHIGNYPIITSDEAEKLLLDGKYIASLHPDKIDKEHIEKVELIYRSTRKDSYIQPYYRFYLKLDSTNIDPMFIIDDPNLQNYAALYVPAVRSEYLTDIEQWDGTIN